MQLKKAQQAKGRAHTTEQENIALSQEESATPHAKAKSVSHVSHALPALLVNGNATFGAMEEQLLAMAHALQEAGFSPYVLCLDGSELMHRAQAQELETLSYGGGIGCSLRVLWRFKRQTPLWIHVFTTASLPMVTRVVSWRNAGMTYIMYSHNPCDSTYQKKYTAKMCRGINSIIFPSQLVAQDWAEKGFCFAHSAVITPAISAEVHTNFLEHPQPQEPSSLRCNFLMFANAYTEEEMDTLFSAMFSLCEEEEKHKGQSFEVRVVGKVPHLERVLTKARGLGVEHRLSLLGEQDIVEVLLSSTVLLLPAPKTLPASMAANHALMTACCLGRPVLAEQVAPYTEYASETVLFVKIQDNISLYKAMHTVVFDASARQKYGQAMASLRPFVLMPRFIQAHMEVYESCLHDLGWKKNLA